MILNTGMEALTAGILGAFVAQVLKLVIDLIKHKRLDFKVFTTAGGMPSSHSAGVVALSVSAGIIEGFTSVIFAVSIGYALVVMYDAAGVRRAAGKISVCLNKMMEDFYHNNVQAAGGKLKELLGHTPKEVVAGALLGVLIAYLYHYILL